MPAIDRVATLPLRRSILRFDHFEHRFAGRVADAGVPDRAAVVVVGPVRAGLVPLLDILLPSGEQFFGRLIDQQVVAECFDVGGWLLSVFRHNVADLCQPRPSAWGTVATTPRSPNGAALGSMRGHHQNDWRCPLETRVGGLFLGFLFASAKFFEHRKTADPRLQPAAEWRTSPRAVRPDVPGSKDIPHRSRARPFVQRNLRGAVRKTEHAARHGRRAGRVCVFNRRRTMVAMKPFAAGLVPADANVSRGRARTRTRPTWRPSPARRPTR